ncbi:MAG: serine protein kinase PrkA [Candidatus Woesearchaeota archaeon]
MDYIKEISEGTKKFENVHQTLKRMILDEHEVRQINVNGKRIFDYQIFRKGDKPIIGLYEVLNSFVSFIKDAAEGGSSSEMAYVLIGEPGGGKTYMVDYLCNEYRRFLSKPENRKYTFKFKNLDLLKKYGNIKEIVSQTYEDPMLLMLNTHEFIDDSLEYMKSKYGFTDKQLEEFKENYRPLGACSEYIYKDILSYSGSVDDVLNNFVEIIPVPLSESQGTITGKYPAKDKITSSAADLLGDESIQRLLNLSDADNPYRFDLRRGALSRVAGGGIHFADEIFKNKRDLVQIYLGVIQNKTIELEGFKWPLDTLVIATSNNMEFNKYVSEQEEAPIIDRCRTCYVGHNTDYKLQSKLTSYAIGYQKKKTIDGQELHQDPNLNYAASVCAVMTRLPRHNKLTSKEMLKLSAGEVAGEKSVKTLVEVIDELNRNSDITKRFGQKGLGQRNLGRALQFLAESHETNEGRCMFALDIFTAFERVILDYVVESSDQEKYLEDLKIAKELYRERINTSMFNAYMDDEKALEKDVMNYVNMIIGIDAENIGTDNIWTYRDPQTGKMKSIKIDKKFINSVEERLGLKTNEQKETFRTTVRKIYGQKLSSNPNYNFLDNVELVKAVCDVRLNSDIAGAGSLSGALANRVNEENQNLYNTVVNSMKEKLGYCNTCAEKTIEYFITPEDES